MIIANPNKDKRIQVKIGGSHPGDVNIALDSGENLGLVQALEIKAAVGDFVTVKLESILEKAEVDILQKQTEVKVILPRDYKLGYWIKFIFSKIFRN